MKQGRARKIMSRLKQLVPDAGMMLKFTTPWECVVAVQLSAQCTDERVNIVTARLFQKYRTLDDYCVAQPAEFEQDIFSCGYYRQKARNILAAARMVRDECGGVVPRTMAEMVRLPGVGRKTANVVLGNAYGVVEGIAVDTHVARFSRVHGLSRARTPEKIEQDLMMLLPRRDWFRATYLMIEYGRRFCTARCKHEKCPLREFVVQSSHGKKFD